MYECDRGLDKLYKIVYIQFIKLDRSVEFHDRPSEVNRKENEMNATSQTMESTQDATGETQVMSNEVGFLNSMALENIGRYMIRYGLVLVLLWIGAMKFTAYEAQAIQGLVANSPFLGWVYSILSVQAASILIGVTEITAALLIAIRPFNAKLSAIGSVFAIGMFVTTLSFILSTPPVWEASLGGFPALSVAPGQFLIKDFVLLGAAIFTLAESIKAIKRA